MEFDEDAYDEESATLEMCDEVVPDDECLTGDHSEQDSDDDALDNNTRMLSDYYSSLDREMMQIMSRQFVPRTSTRGLKTIDGVPQYIYDSFVRERKGVIDALKSTTIIGGLPKEYSTLFESAIDSEPTPEALEKYKRERAQRFALKIQHGIVDDAVPTATIPLQSKTEAVGKPKRKHH